MELIRKVRDRTARAASRLSAEPGAQTRWAQRARFLFYALALALLGGELYLTYTQGVSGLETALRIAAAALLIGLARWPVIVGAISIPVVLAEYSLGLDPLSLMIVLPLVTTGVLVATQPRQLAYSYAVVVIVVHTAMEPTELPLADLATWVTVFLVPCLIGEGARFMLRSVEGIRRASAVQLTRQRRDLARELHDTSIHDITAMIMALERAKLAGIDDPKVVEEIDHAIAIGRQSVVSMRGVLKILRTEDSEELGKSSEGMPAAFAAATPTVSRALDEARATLARSGHDLRVHLEDELELPMPFSVRTALVRVIQECTANMAKYARPGAPCTVMIERTDAETRALFINEAEEDAAIDSAMSSGVGLIGVRERVEAVGGRLAVRHHGGRWMIQASIPTVGSATEGQVERAAQH